VVCAVDNAFGRGLRDVRAVIKDTLLASNGLQVESAWFTIRTAGQLNNCQVNSRAPKRGVAPRHDFYESLSHNFRCGLWPARAGTYLACLPGRPALGDGPLVRSHHRYCRRSMSLGLALV